MVHCDLDFVSLRYITFHLLPERGLGCIYLHMIAVMANIIFGCLYHHRMVHISRQKRLWPSTPPQSIGWRAEGFLPSPSLHSLTNMTPSCLSWPWKDSRRHTGLLKDISCYLFIIGLSSEKSGGNFV